MKPSDETTRDAARGSCWPRSEWVVSKNRNVGCVHNKLRGYLLKDKERIEGKDNRIAMGEI